MIDSLSKYILPDGEILSFKVVYSDESNTLSYIVIELKVRIWESKNKWKPCKIRLRFSELIEIRLVEDFGTGGSYSDITFTKSDTEGYYLSLDPYNNRNEPDEMDNFVIQSKKIEVEEL
jgi:hypothetical protein